MRWLQNLFPRDEAFFDLFERHAGHIVEAADAMDAMLRGGPEISRHCRAVHAAEAAADDVAREVLLAVRRTFITPFDRSDITGLIRAMDDAVDQMQQTAKTVTLFEQNRFPPCMQRLGDVAREAAGLTATAVPLLRRVGTNGPALSAFAEQVVKLEDHADGLYDDGLRELFRGGDRPPQALEFVVGARIYDHLEDVVDRFEDVANAVSAIVVEHA
jgi:uncharacterized protein